MIKWMDVESYPPKEGDFAVSPISHLGNVISGKICWDSNTRSYFIESVFGETYHIFKEWILLPSLPEKND